MSMKNKQWQIYLAGKMNGLSLEEMDSWRVEACYDIIAAAKCRDNYATVIDPVGFYNFEHPMHQSEEEVMDFDLARVCASDILIVNAEGLDTSTGTQIEIYEAWKNGIPVLMFGKYDNPHPWIERCVTRHEKSIDDVINYLNGFYFV